MEVGCRVGSWTLGMPQGASCVSCSLAAHKHVGASEGVPCEIQVLLVPPLPTLFFPEGSMFSLPHPPQPMVTPWAT